MSLPLPGSLSFLLLGLAISAALLRGSGRRLAAGRALLVVLVGFYTVFSMPFTARLVAAAMARGYPPYRGEAADTIRAVVVLDGGTARFAAAAGQVETLNAASAFRVLEARRVAALLREPVFVLTGGAYEAELAASEVVAMRNYLLAHGVDASRIVVDQASRNTREHALNLPRLLRQRGIDRFVLVTSATHIRRAMRAFEANGSRPIASPAEVINRDRPPWRAFLPQPHALRVTEEAAHDLVGLAYYWSRGWLTRTGQ